MWHYKSSVDTLSISLGSRLEEFQFSILVMNFSHKSAALVSLSGIVLGAWSPDLECRGYDVSP